MLVSHKRIKDADEHPGGRKGCGASVLMEVGNALLGCHKRIETTDKYPDMEEGGHSASVPPPGVSLSP